MCVWARRLIGPNSTAISTCNSQQKTTFSTGNRCISSHWINSLSFEVGFLPFAWNFLLFLKALRVMERARRHVSSRNLKGEVMAENRCRFDGPAKTARRPSALHFRHVYSQFDASSIRQLSTGFIVVSFRRKARPVSA